MKVKLDDDCDHEKVKYLVQKEIYHCGDCGEWFLSDPLALDYDPDMEDDCYD